MERKTTSIKFDEELWRKVKSNCALKGLDISDYLEGLVRKDLKVR